jgi:hypothetical protein
MSAEEPDNAFAHLLDSPVAVRVFIALLVALCVLGARLLHFACLARPLCIKQLMCKPTRT